MKCVLDVYEEFLQNVCTCVCGVCEGLYTRINVKLRVRKLYKTYLYVQRVSSEPTWSLNVIICSKKHRYRRGCYEFRNHAVPSLITLPRLSCVVAENNYTNSHNSFL